jgi:hypothetical protein
MRVLALTVGFAAAVAAEPVRVQLSGVADSAGLVKRGEWES